MGKVLFALLAPGFVLLALAGVIGAVATMSVVTAHPASAWGNGSAC
jgi:hypothetical protein